MDLATHPRPYVSVQALATYLECDPRTIARMIANKSLTAAKVGRVYRIPVAQACETFHVQRQIQT